MSGRKIDINKATIDELSNLIGVGRAKAEAIFEARKVWLFERLLFLHKHLRIAKPKVVTGN